MINILVCGSRGFSDSRLMVDVLNKAVDGRQVHIIQGGAKGADKMAKTYAVYLGIPTTTIRPDWDTYGKRAGMIRNEQMLDRSDEVIAFWDGQSRGTRHTIEQAQEMGLSTTVIRFERDE